MTSCTYGHRQGAWVGAREEEGHRKTQKRVRKMIKSVMRAYNKAALNTRLKTFHEKKNRLIHIIKVCCRICGFPAAAAS